MSKSSTFYVNQLEPIKSCFLAMRHILMNFDTAISETVKYGMPCFCYKETAFCYLWTDKKTGEPYFLFVEGKQLNHPALESENRARMKVYKVNPNEDLPINTITALLTEALDLYKKGTVKTKK